jgi:hypothetical protein
MSQMILWSLDIEAPLRLNSEAYAASLAQISRVCDADELQVGRHHGFG